MTPTSLSLRLSSPEETGKKLISTLQESGYDGALSIEHEDPVWEGSEQKVKHGLALGLKHLSQFVVRSDFSH